MFPFCYFTSKTKCPFFPINTFCIYIILKFIFGVPVPVFISDTTSYFFVVLLFYSIPFIFSIRFAPLYSYYISYVTHFNIFRWLFWHFIPIAILLDIVCLPALTISCNFFIFKHHHLDHQVPYIFLYYHHQHRHQHHRYIILNIFYFFLFYLTYLTTNKIEYVTKNREHKPATIIIALFRL